MAADVGLLEGWRRYGEPIVVGAVAHGLVVAPDVDLEVYCDEPLIADGFALLSRWAQHPRVYAASFRNALDTPDLGLYWQLRYTAADGERWKVDMWSVRHDHPGPLGRDLIAPMAAALTRESRAAILALKEALRREGRRRGALDRPVPGSARRGRGRRAATRCLAGRAPGPGSGRLEAITTTSAGAPIAPGGRRMSYERGMAALHLEMPDRIPHTEYVSHWELVRHVTGLDPNARPSATRPTAASTSPGDYDLLWNTNDGPVPWQERGRTTDMGHAE